MDQQTTQQSSSNIAIYAGILIIGILIGAGGSFAYFNHAAGNSYQAGTAAKNLSENSGPNRQINLPAVIHTIPGTVTSITGKQFSMHTQLPPQIVGKILADHTVLINKSTTVVKLVQKDPKVYRAEMNKFLAARKAEGNVAANLPPVRPPFPFATTTASVSEISVGSRVLVTSAQNIKTLKEITATNIQIYPKRTQAPAQAK